MCTGPRLRRPRRGAGSGSSSASSSAAAYGGHGRHVRVTGHREGAEGGRNRGGALAFRSSSQTSTQGAAPACIRGAVHLPTSITRSLMRELRRAPGGVGSRRRLRLQRTWIREQRGCQGRLEGWVNLGRLSSCCRAAERSQACLKAAAARWLPVQRTQDSAAPIATHAERPSS